MRLSLLASGSKGNSLFLETDSCRLLIDAGLSGRETTNRLASIGVDAATLDGILVTHEHTDHIRSVGTLARRLKIPVLGSSRMLQAAHHVIGKAECIEFEAGAPFTFKGVSIDPFPVTHDACDPVGFRIESGEGCIGFATDLGIATRLTQEKLKGCRALVLEFNHDEQMLQDGPYPWHLKQRIRSRHGHLSNAEGANLLEELLHGDLQGVFLSHLSEVNNDPALALAAARGLLSRQNLCGPDLFLGCQHQVSGVFKAD
ncbi:MBL fold metallo-hydrolase [Geomonas paludis]|uniref:MBL fold metallo-hydrolase n=1 Tax=Geomonas paludis TaxID=2740185 RepID=A0A6V8MVX9_9BACT|nr:MBL fold metallo-hydrolase [Geomonas paludis]UPU38016.1 MBL fold metallo-hydrolase [Geomonas paludis]GFO63459.1 MBL fold metallo-hydrolase [Geomonas paludis]